MKTILIQAAVENELTEFLNFFDNNEHILINGYNFYISSFEDKKIILTLTGSGIINATINTMLAINTFKPDIVINQGSCGGHTAKMKVGEIVIATEAVYMNSYKTPIKTENEGSNALEWIVRNEFKARATEKLINIAQKTFENKAKFGVAGTGDMFSRETDRINHLHSIFNHLCEDKETYAVYKVCDVFNIDHIGIRIISNNELLKNAGSFRENYSFCAPIIKDYILKFIKNI